MIKYKYLYIAVLLVFIAMMVLPVQAEEEKKKDDTVFYGSFMVGYRGVDITGVESKYKEDYNLDSGARLFNFYVYYEPTGTLKKYFDRMHLSLHNFGGDPFESLSFNIAKYGTYQFKYDRRKSNYFYQDNFEGLDFHTYDFDRIADSALLKVWLCNFAKLYFSFDRYTKKGVSTTSLDITHEEFEFEKPIDESSIDVSVGLEMSYKWMNLYVEEKIQDYENDYHFFLPGASPGEDASDLSYLDYFYFNQPYDFRSFTHTGRITLRPFSNLLFKASASIGNQDLRMDYSESQEGISYLGTPFTYNYTGDGDFERELGLYNVELTYLFTDRFAFTGAVRYSTFDQEGTVNTYGEAFMMDMNYETLGIEGGLQYQATSNVGVTAGVRYEEREVSITQDGESEDETNKRTGVFGNIKWNPIKGLGLTADYQYGSYEDPFTSIAPTDMHRARFTARYKMKNYYLTGSYVYQLSENDIDDGWKTEKSQANIRAGYHSKYFKLSLGYGLIYSKSEGDRNFVFYGSPAVWNIFYEGRTNMFDGYLSLNFAKKWTLGSYANYYKNDGSWEVERLILRPYLELKFENGFVGQVAYRYIDFKENVLGLNDYEANIFEISFGYRW